MPNGLRRVVHLPHRLQIYARHRTSCPRFLPLGGSISVHHALPPVSFSSLRLHRSSLPPANISSHLCHMCASIYTMTALFVEFDCWFSNFFPRSYLLPCLHSHCPTNFGAYDIHDHPFPSVHKNNFKFEFTASNVSTLSLPYTPSVPE